MSNNNNNKEEKMIEEITEVNFVCAADARTNYEYSRRQGIMRRAQLAKLIERESKAGRTGCIALIANEDMHLVRQLEELGYGIRKMEGTQYGITWVDAK